MLCSYHNNNNNDNNNNSRTRLWEAMDVFMISMVVMVSQVHAYPQTYRIVCVRYAHFLYVNHTSTKQLKNRTSPLGTLTPPRKKAGLAKCKMGIHMERSKVPLPLISTNCQYKSEATFP